jgi:hypothetical protein
MNLPGALLAGQLAGPGADSLLDVEPYCLHSLSVPSFACRVALQTARLQG